MENIQLAKKVMKSYDEAYRDCRDIGHIWQQVEVKVGGDHVYRTLRCGRCTTERHEMFSKTGELTTRHYYHAPNYLLKSEDGVRYTKQFWRGLAYLQAAGQTR